ncbi:NAD(P)H-dependent oxidoreductase [Kibdelosporangium persicum]|uniref:NADPH-dependent FMN reductase n=1 Tax=Kibdelosporangium persicum TaxID=2698649 RepID=A0ABX2FD11_9PSEU|nr:NAD(P)H-dependent oxidoreductase [Kibdelosporangium persicum]NRN69044.1 NADPH-dependent FMN reductase [Kibdelosporangium persicum]
MATILIVSGSPSPQAPTAVLLRRVSDVLTGLGHEVHLLVVRDLPTVALLSADLLDPTIRNVMDLVDRADGVVVASPVYRAAYSGLVQSLLNLLARTALSGKVVLPLANGGSQGHLVALDYALRPLLIARGATDVVPGHFVLDADVHDEVATTVSGGLDAAVRRFANAVAERPGLATAS